MAENGRLEDFVIITGFSGAGKSQAMATFEDAGYFCVVDPVRCADAGMYCSCGLAIDTGWARWEP